MPNDSQLLKPSVAVRLLNSTPLGEVISERQLYRHRSRAGARIGDDRHVDLLRYAGWLVQVFHKPKPTLGVDLYERNKENAHARSRSIALAGRDIGELPAVCDPKRKKAAATDFELFCESYFPQTFYLPQSGDHLKVMQRVEEAVLRGGLFAVAMPRGSGKSTICECACIWAMLYGHRPFVCLIGSDEGHAAEMLDSIKTELSQNETLLEDFPEVVFPIQALDGIANRCSGQLHKGERTHIGWKQKEVILPTIPNSPASGSIIRVAGITGGLRGMKYKRPDARTVRPSLVIIDDPQTDESARSLSQCAARESILLGAVLGLGGPGVKISGIMPCTVIRRGDLADRILNREKFPEFGGERTKMVYSFPVNEDLWKEYAQIRAIDMQQGGNGESATKFYRQNQAAMDEAAVVAWPERFNPDEISGIQHAMNLKIRNEAAFFAEYQNDPLPDDVDGQGELAAEELCEKLNGLQRCEIPTTCNHLTIFIDIQATLLYYLATAWEDDFTGYVIDYGSFPDQNLPYFTLRDARNTLADATRLPALEGSIYAGLKALTDDLLGRQWIRDDGALLPVERCLIDANWGATTDLVYQFCRQSRYSSTLMPCHGRYVGASGKPFAEYTKQHGDRVGHNWRVPSVEGKRVVRHVAFDSNYWKTFVHARLAVPMGDRGCLSFYGLDSERHRMLAEQLTSEFRIKTEGRGRTVDEWKRRPNQLDNHFLDCLVGCCVAASMQGARMDGVTTEEAYTSRKKVTREWLERNGWSVGQERGI